MSQLRFVDINLLFLTNRIFNKQLLFLINIISNNKYSSPVVISIYGHTVYYLGMNYNVNSIRRNTVRMKYISMDLLDVTYLA